MKPRHIRRILRFPPNGNIIVRMADGPPIELLLESECPECSVKLGPHTKSCTFFETMTFDELVKRGYARRVEQI